ncbi:hypothetical protein BDV96DRAFT_599988 [Lophiotrema nucula]|uniref:Uncharacterized protein n=1 Tax=Lophiotrema nucula TaxID=690887 RepID=A0A6A5Z8V0_9PLEO|nr:hypothetical protein BDV96DRAFT_599988 [Lophiotrema nucula]
MSIPQPTNHFKVERQPAQEPLLEAEEMSLVSEPPILEILAVGLKDVEAEKWGGLQEQLTSDRSDFSRWLKVMPETASQNLIQQREGIRDQIKTQGESFWEKGNVQLKAIKQLYIAALNVWLASVADKEEEHARRREAMFAALNSREISISIHSHHDFQEQNTTETRRASLTMNGTTIKNLVLPPRKDITTYSPSTSFLVEYLADLVALVRFKKWQHVYVRLVSGFFREEIVLQYAKKATTGQRIVALYNELVNTVKDVDVKDAVRPSLIQVTTGRVQQEDDDGAKKEAEGNIELEARFSEGGTEEKLNELAIHILRAINAENTEAFDSSAFRFSILGRVTGDDDSEWERIWPLSEKEREPFKPYWWGSPDTTLQNNWLRLNFKYWTSFDFHPKQLFFQELVKPHSEDQKLLQQVAQIRSDLKFVGPGIAQSRQMRDEELLEVFGS